MTTDPYLRDNLPPTKLLSIFLQGRNDNYMGNFLWRLSTALNNIARNISVLGAHHEIEVMLIDWGSESPLLNSLTLSEGARQHFKFVLVAPEVAKFYDKDARFSGAHASNALARRASGKYFMYADADIFITLDSFAKILNGLRKGYIDEYSLDESFFWASKYHIPQTFTQINPSIEEVDEHVEKHWQTFARERVNRELFRGCGACLLAKREMWLDSSGWDERLIYWGWCDIDWHIRLNEKYGWSDLEDHGIKIFHLEHYADRSGTSATENPRKMNPISNPVEFAPNPPDWGLRDRHLKIIDGFGLPIPAGGGRELGRELSKFSLRQPPSNVANILATNPIYKSVTERFEMNFVGPFNNDKVLENLLNAVQPASVLEVGASFGAGTQFLAKFNSVKNIFCVDEWDKNKTTYCKNDAVPEKLLYNYYEQFLANCYHSELASKVYPIRASSVEGAAYCMKYGIKFDLIYVSGDRATHCVKRNIDIWLPLLTVNGVICGDGWALQSEPQNVAGGVAAIAKKLGWEVVAEGNFWIILPKERLAGPQERAHL